MSSDHPQLPPGVRLELGEAVSRCPKAAQEGREQQSGMHIRPGSGHGDLGDVSTQPVEVGTKTGCPVLAHDWCWSRSQAPRASPRLCLGYKAPSLPSSARARGCPHCQGSPKAEGASFCPLVLLQSPPGDISGELEAVKFKHQELNPLAS